MKLDKNLEAACVEIEGVKYIDCAEAALQLGVTKKDLLKSMNDFKMTRAHGRIANYIAIDVLEQWKKEFDDYIDFFEIHQELIQETDSFMVSSYRRIHDVKIYLYGNKCFGLRLEKNLPYKKTRNLSFYVHKDDKEKLKDILREKYELFKKPADVCMKILLRDERFDDKQTLKQCIEEMFKITRKEFDASFLEIINFFRNTLEKDLCLYNDDEIRDYFVLVKKELTGKSIKLFVMLYSFMQQKEVCHSNMIFDVDKKPVGKGRDVEPYDFDTFVKMAYMIFNPEHWKKEDMLKKATEKAWVARNWLRFAMIYVCDWRTTDVEYSLPRITLPNEPKEILKCVLEQTIPEDIYKAAANELVNKVHYKPLKPHKTESIDEAPPLKLYIPESFLSTLGMLFMLCEAHQRILHYDDSLCGKVRLNYKECVYIFGKEYEKMFKNNNFSTLRGNKSRMNLLANEADETNIDGYLIAAYSRSHIGGINTLPETTSIYLKAKMDDYSKEQIFTVLYERGVCSFIPYLLCSALKKDVFLEASVQEQTEMMKLIKYNPYEIERILENDEVLETIIKGKIDEIIKWTNKENLYDFIKEMLSNIASGNCNGKDRGVYCLKRACLQECSQKSRTTCIGCGNEIYVKAFLMQLNKEIKFQEQKLECAKTDGEKIKRTAILNTKLYPAAYETLSTMKYIYNQDIENYKKLFMGEENGSISAS